MERVELLIFEEKDFKEFKSLPNKYNIVNVYIKVNIKSLSEVRQKLIELGYTTRLFVTIESGVKKEYIFGKKKGQNGVFNEKCKNSIVRNSIAEVIKVSSNSGDKVLVDSESLLNKAKVVFKNERDWVLL